LEAFDAGNQQHPPPEQRKMLPTLSKTELGQSRQGDKYKSGFFWFLYSLRVSNPKGLKRVALLQKNRRHKRNI
jgi:hypothetical protein